MKLRLGPAGLGAVKTAIGTLEHYHAQGFGACEVAFTYGAYIKTETDARAIGKRAKELGIALSIHAPYYVNLNSSEKKKQNASMQRILECCKVGHWLGAHRVVFHPGYYGTHREESYHTIKENVIKMMKQIEKEKWNILLAPETMGKVNVFGSLDEIAQLVQDTGCSFCLDFAHLLARDKQVDYNKVARLFPQTHWHVHFSGIVYGEKGEKHHVPTEKEAWRTLLEHVPRDKEVTLINESPTMIEDCVEGLQIARRLTI